MECLLWIGVCSLILFAAVWGMLRMRSRSNTPRARGFMGDQNATVAISFALMFPLALLMVFVIVQAALMFNVNMVVNYSAYAAARSAIVWVPISMEPESQNLVMNPDFSGNLPSDKMPYVRRAAVLALIPISNRLDPVYAPSSDSGFSGEDVLTQMQQVFGRSGKKVPVWSRRVPEQYAYADAHTKVEIAMPHHWRDGNPDNDCPYNRTRGTGEWEVNEWRGWYEVTESYCPFNDERWDYASHEALELTVTYVYELTVPFASRILGKRFTRADGKRGYGRQIQKTCIMNNEGPFELRPKG